jgi:hypothetical protein
LLPEILMHIQIANMHWTQFALLFASASGFTFYYE